MPIKFINEDVKKLLGDDLFAKVDAALKDQDVAVELSKNFRPADRVREIEAQRDEHKTRADKVAKDFDDLVKSLGANNADEFKTKYQGMVENHKKELQDAEMRFQSREKDYLVADALRTAKAKNPNIAMKALDLSKVGVKDGKLDGLDPLLQALKTSDPYLFEAEIKPQLDRMGNPINKGAGFDQTVEEKAAAIAKEHGIVLPQQK